MNYMDYTMEQRYQLIKDSLLKTNDRNPITIVKSIMKKGFISIHGPEHHFLDGASLMTAMKNSGLDIDLSAYLDKLAERTIKMPGAMCGYWGMCGSVASVTAVFALIDKTGPLSNDASYGKHMAFSSKVIARMSEIGGPRCCKRNAFISLGEAVKYANKQYHLDMDENISHCEFSSKNQQCLKEKCPFYKK